MKDKKGKIIAGIEIVRNITESERLKRELTESEKKFRNLAEESLVPLIANGKVKGILEVFHRSIIMPDKDLLTSLKPSEAK